MIYKLVLFLQISWQTKRSTLPNPLVFTRRLLRVKSSAKKTTLKPRHKWDRVPASCTMVYESGLKTYINGLYITVAFVSLSTTSLLAFRWQQLSNTISFWDCIYLAGTTSLILFSLAFAYRFARTVIIRIYHDPDSGQFIAVRRTCFGRLHQIGYYPREVQPKQSGKLTNQNVTESVDVKIKGQDYYLSASSFISPIYYNAHLGGDDGHRDLSKSFVSGPRF